jgi:hypothetical protein
MVLPVFFGFFGEPARGGKFERIVVENNDAFVILRVWKFVPQESQMQRQFAR